MAGLITLQAPGFRRIVRRPFIPGVVALGLDIEAERGLEAALSGLGCVRAIVTSQVSQVGL